VPASPADTAAAQAALTDLGYAFAPRVEAETGRVFLDVADLGRLYPHERAVAQGLVAQAARVGLAVRVAIASSKAVARAAAEVDNLALVPTGRAAAAAFLASHPVSAGLRALPGVADGDATELGKRLRRWGIRTLGELAALPAAEVTLRLGPIGTRLGRLAAGTLEEPLTPHAPPDALEEGTDLDWAVHELEPLAFVLRGLIERALARLTCRGLGCAGLTLRLKLDPRGYEVREVPLAAPTREAAMLLQLARLTLARRPPSGPVVGVALLALPARVRAAQLDLLRPAGPAPERLATTLVRLAALVGMDNVGAPAPVDSFREETVALQPFGANGHDDQDTPAPPPCPTLGFRRFRPPHDVQVLMGRDGPVALHGKETTARVLVAAGPYRADGEWWTAGGFCRDYWDVQASDGAVYRVHQDRQNGRWFLDGYYD